MEWFLFVCPLAIVGGIAYALVAMIGRTSGNHDASASELIHNAPRSYQVDDRR